MTTPAVRTAESVREQLLAFAPEIRIARRDAAAFFERVLADDPTTAFYLESYRGTVSVLGGETVAVYRVTYAHRDIPSSAVTLAGTGAEAEAFFHRGIGRYLPTAALCVPRSVDVGRIYQDFMVTYGAYYSNLLGIENESFSFPDSPWQYMICRFRYRIGRVKLHMMETAVEEEVQRLSHLLFDPAMTPQTKAYVAHNYLAREVEYWLKEDANPLEESYMQSAYGALINHRCVCQGYAEAYKRLMDKAGVPCEVLCGKIRGSAEYHAWNAVSFDGRVYYHVDVTWDASDGGGISWQYFCRSDREMNPTRIWTRREGVNCTGTENVAALARSQIALKKTLFLSHGIDRKYL